MTQNLGHNRTFGLVFTDGSSKQPGGANGGAGAGGGLKLAKVGVLMQVGPLGRNSRQGRQGGSA